MRGIIDAAAEPLLRSRVLLARLLLRVPMLFLGQHWKICKLLYWCHEEFAAQIYASLV